MHNGGQCCNKLLHIAGPVSWGHVVHFISNCSGAWIDVAETTRRVTQPGEGAACTFGPFYDDDILLKVSNFIQRLHSTKQFKLRVV